MKKDVLKRLQLTELDILKEIDCICKKYDIKYFLIYGTLLGAVRHKGFIPWDDDVDIGMLQDDYTKFIKIAPLELPDKYFLDYFSTNKNYYLPFAKIRNSLTSFEEKNTVNYNGNKGVWVDIFPFGYTKHKNVNKLMKLKFRGLELLYSLLLEKKLKLGTCGWKARLISKILPYRFVTKLIEILTLTTKISDNLVLYNTPMIFKKDTFFPIKTLEFEGDNYFVPNDYDVVLKQLYGDYMKLPPINKRITHNPLKIVFEDGETHIFNK